MRWLASLVVLCLMAASGVRPVEPVRRAAHATEIEAAKGLAPAIANRRATHAPPLARLPSFVITPRLAFAPPPRLATLAPVDARPCAVLWRSVACSARGPPLG